jgi:hypothetical protein
VWGPEDLVDDGIGRADNWIIKAEKKGRKKKNEDPNWHGFGDLADGFNMLDPIKATIVTPGLNLDGKFDKTGIPASVLTKFLTEHGVVVEKTGLYSFFIMFTIGITKGRWNSLLTALQQFKDDYDRNQPMWRIMPEFCQKQPKYERMGLRDLCQHIHTLYAKYDIARLTTEMYLSDLTPAMTPADAYAQIARRKTERVAIDELEGRITVGLVTPYPPGIPLLVPGEVFNKKIVGCEPAPPFLTLTRFGGFFSIEEYRASFNNIIMTVIAPPFLMYPLVIQEKHHLSTDTNEVVHDETVLSTGHVLRGLRRPQKALTTSPGPGETTSVISDASMEPKSVILGPLTVPALDSDSSSDGEVPESVVMDASIVPPLSNVQMDTEFYNRLAKSTKMRGRGRGRGSGSSRSQFGMNFQRGVSPAPTNNMLTSFLINK